MKRILTLIFVLYTTLGCTQLTIDTLAIQDFELVPMTPTWTFTGPVVYNSGYSSNTAAPPSSPIGIGGSRAWESTTQSSGLVLEFANIPVPSGYDSIRVHFRLAAMNLNSSTGGPDHLDYVLVEISNNGGSTYYSRLRIRGAVANNSFWPYSATGVAKVYYLPATEVMFQPTNSGLQTTEGYSNCEIVFPGNVTQVRVKITGRSSSASDTWLIDNLIISAEKPPCNSYDTINPEACFSYTSPSSNYNWTTSGTYIDTIPNALGCDSIITINLTINTVDTAVLINHETLTANVTGAHYQWVDCNNSFAPIIGDTNQSFTATVNGNYAVIITQNNCTDTSGCHNIMSTGSDKLILNNIINVYPNPAGDKILIKSFHSLYGKEFIITDQTGRQVLKDKLTSDNSFVDISNLEGGCYIIQIKERNFIPIQLLKL